MTLKLRLLKHISRWEWGYRIVESEYWRTKIYRERRRAWRLKKAVKLANERMENTNKRQYVMEIPNGRYWIGTSKEWTLLNRGYAKRRWPIVDHVYMTK